MQNYPLAWPPGWRRTPPQNRKLAKFTSRDPNGFAVELTVTKALKRVMYELGRFSAHEVLISTMLRARQDGLPYSDQPNPLDPGAAVYWRYKAGGVRVMAIDTYTHVADNLAAIAATLEAMRAIERHDGAQILDRAFTGFEALPAPDAFDPWRVLGIPPLSPAVTINEAFRAKALDAHPDRPSGSTQRFQQLERARREALEAVG